jgi:hypothetical protein
MPLFAMAYLKGDLSTMWHEPFAASPAGQPGQQTPKYQVV